MIIGHSEISLGEMQATAGPGINMDMDFSGWMERRREGMNLDGWWEREYGNESMDSWEAWYFDSCAGYIASCMWSLSSTTQLIARHASFLANGTARIVFFN
jgi:hypothetical protein